MSHDAASRSRRSGRRPAPRSKRSRPGWRPRTRRRHPLITAVVPSAADPVSLQTAAGFSAQGSEHAAVAAEGVEELGRAGVGVGESGVSYAAGDAAAAATYWMAGPDDDRAGLDGFAAGGAFGAAQQRSWTRVAVGGRRGVDCR